MRKLIAVVVLVASVGTGVAVAQSQDEPATIPIGPNAQWPEDLVTAPDGVTKIDPNMNKGDNAGIPLPGEPATVAGPDGKALVCPGKTTPVTIKKIEPPPGIVKATREVKNGVETYTVTRDAIVRCTASGAPVWVPATPANVANKVAPTTFQTSSYLAR